MHLDPQRPGGPNELEVASSRGSITIRDVLIGEVWLCSGQSITQFALRSASRAALDLPRAENPECNIYSEEGLSASPFRTDDWPGITFSAR